MYSRLTRLALRRAFSRIINPMLLLVPKNRTEEIFGWVREYDLGGKLRKQMLARLLGPEIVSFGPIEPFALRRFGLIRGIFDRDTVFMLAEQPEIIKIYSDEPAYIMLSDNTTYRTVPAEGIIEIAYAKKIKNITTTYYTKFLMGAHRAHSRGFYGDGVKVAIIDTGCARWHEQIGRAIFDTVMPLQRIDENGHGCVSPDTYIYVSNYGLITIEEFWKRMEQYGKYRSALARENAYRKIVLDNGDEIIDLSETRENTYMTYSLDPSTGRIERTKIKKVVRIPIDEEIVVVKLSDGSEFKLTPWHKVFVVENGRIVEKRADELNIGDTIPSTEFLSEHARSKLYGELRLKEVVEIRREHYRGYFYDLEIDKYANYVAGRGEGMMFVHNTWCVACIGGIRTRDDVLSRAVGRDVWVEGMAPRCTLIAIKALGYVLGTGSTSQILMAIDRAMQYQADIVSMSLGGRVQGERPEDDPYYTALDELVKNNVIPVVASGNEGPKEGTVGSPGALPQALTVGAYDPITGEVAEFSSRGPTPWGDVKPDTVAPGVNIHSATVYLLDFSGDGMPNRYTPLSGTSMATPHVSGLVTLMRQAHKILLDKLLTVDEIKAMLKELGHSKNNVDGWGPITWDMYETWLSTQYGVEIHYPETAM